MHPLIIQTPQHESQEEYVDAYLSEHVIDTNRLYHILPVGSSILLDQVRELRRDLQQSKRNAKTIVFHTFERATPEAQNALLKAIEELGDAHQFLFFTTQVDAILSTIRSRCVVRVMTVEHEAVVDVILKSLLDSLKRERSVTVLAREEFQPATREDALLLFTRIITALRSDLQSGDRWAVSVSQKALSLLSLLQSNNLNHQLAVDQWLIYSLYI